MKTPFKADCHVHTCYSPDSLADIEGILEAAVKKGLSAIAITDHDTISGALEAKKIACKLPLQVIIGEEITTGKGDLLAYFVKKRIVPGPLSAVLDEVKKQGAVCCCAHPYDQFRKGVRPNLVAKDQLKKIHAIEVFNARSFNQSYNQKALSFAKKHKKVQLAGSDAHHASEVGRAYVEFKGIKKLGRNSLISAKRKIHGTLSPAYVRFFSKYAKLRKMLSSGIK